MKAKINLCNIIAYSQGKIRYKLFYSKFAFLIRPHIREQIEARIRSMDKDCYSMGQCKLCGCQTTALQMADKACDKPCYPAMLNKKNWNIIKKYNELPFIQKSIEGTYSWKIVNNKFIKYNNE